MVLRRHLLGMALFGTAMAGGKASAQSAPRTTLVPLSSLGPASLGLDASQFGLRPGSADDQSRRLQEALGCDRRDGQGVDGQAAGHGWGLAEAG